MLTISGVAIINSKPVIPDGKSYVYFRIREGDYKYDCYAFDGVADRIMRMHIKEGSLVYFTGEMKRKKPQFLVPDEKWKEGFPDEDNPTGFSNPCFSIQSIDYAIPESYYKKQKEQAEASVRGDKKRIETPLKMTGFGE